MLIFLLKFQQITTRKINILAKITKEDSLCYHTEGRHGKLAEVRQTFESLHQNHPELLVYDEVQLSFALNNEHRSQKFPFTLLENRDVNAIIFPNLTSGNIAYKLMQEEIVGPILMGMKKPIHVVPTECSVREIVHIPTIALVDAQ